VAGIPLRVVLPMVARGFRAGRDGGNRRSFDFALRAALRMTVPLLVTYNEGGMGLTRKFAGRSRWSQGDFVRGEMEATAGPSTSRCALRSG
jgi:hypothetical protein